MTLSQGLLEVPRIRSQDPRLVLQPVQGARLPRAIPSPSTVTANTAAPTARAQKPLVSRLKFNNTVISVGFHHGCLSCPFPLCFYMEFFP